MGTHSQTGYRNQPQVTVYRDLIALDYRSLPDADCVVTVTVTERQWNAYVRGRGRELDHVSNVLSTFPTQEFFVRAGQEYCAERGIPHIVFDNCETPISKSADGLYAELEKIEVVPRRG